MKKLVSLLLSMIMLIGLVPCAMADEEAMLTFATEWSGGPEAIVATESPFMQIWMEKTGIQVKGVTATVDQLAVSPVKPDIILVYDSNRWMGDNLYNLISYGELISLNDMIDKGLLPNYVAALESTGDGFQCIANDDGVIPGFFMLRAKDSPRAFSGMLIRQDWLAEFGLEMPKTVADWDNVLRTFNEKKGAKLSGMWGNLDSMQFAFGVTDTFYRDGNTIKFGPVEDNYGLFINQMHTWYADGILDPDVFTESTDATYAKIANGEIGAIFGYTGSTFNKIFTMSEEVINGWAAAPVPVLSEENPINVAFETPTADGLYCYVISADCENPELAAQFLDWLYSEEGTMLCNFGVEGVTYELDENGRPYFTDFVKNNPKGYSANEVREMYSGQLNKPMLVTRDGLMVGYESEAQKNSLEVWMDADNTMRQLPKLTFTTEENDELNKIMITIKTYVSENKLNFIYGNRSVEEFEEFRAEIKKMGIDRALEIYQAAYDRFVAR